MDCRRADGVQQGAGRLAPEWSDADRLGGFCLLFKREVVSKVGLLDETSEQGVFDADAVCFRVRRAGYHLACCRDLFLHQFGIWTQPPGT
jgi:GT2 family glycosyltransferase